MAEPLSAFVRRRLVNGEPFAIVTVAEAEGSTPRERGAAMAVSATAVAGTIGGGRLEWDAVDAARAMLETESKSRTISVGLGPAIGQCCGGRVALSIERGGPTTLDRLLGAEAAAAAARSAVFVYGAGHVGRALAAALAPLPFRVTLIDGRAEELALLDEPRVERLLSDAPATLAEAAPAGAAHAVMTHSHALDSLIAAALLERGGFGYLGLIGSATKRALFLKAFRELGLPEAAIRRVVCPIGGGAVRDKRPEVIAALAVAEIATALLGSSAAPSGSHSDSTR